MRVLSLATVEDAVSAALRVRLGDAVKTLKTYQGNWREDLQREGWRLPAVLVIFEASRAEQVGLSSYDLSLSLRILVIVRRLRGEAAGDDGVYEILAGIRQTLWHQDLGLDMLPLALVREEALPALREYAVHAAHYRTGMVQDF
jgi:phage gp37-like protein